MGNISPIGPACPYYYESFLKKGFHPDIVPLSFRVVAS